MLTSAIICAYQDPKKAAAYAAAVEKASAEGAPAPPKPAAEHPPLPDTLAGWAECVARRPLLFLLPQPHSNHCRAQCPRAT